GGFLDRLILCRQAGFQQGPAHESRQARLMFILIAPVPGVGLRRLQVFRAAIDRLVDPRLQGVALSPSGAGGGKPKNGQQSSSAPMSHDESPCELLTIEDNVSARIPLALFSHATGG